MSEIPPSKDVVSALFPSVGSLVINWSLVEQSLDHWVAIIYQSVGGNTIEREIPKNFSRKTDYLKKCFRKIPNLAPFSDLAVQYIADAERLSEIRHTVVHGTLSAYEPETKRVKFIKIDIDKKAAIHTMEAKYLSIEELLEAGGECGGLMTKTLALGKRLADTFVRK